MSAPTRISIGSRVVVRLRAGIDSSTGRMQYRDRIGHIVSYDGETLLLRRDAAANGSHPEETIAIPTELIHIMKPIPERLVGATRRSK